MKVNINVFLNELVKMILLITENEMFKEKEIQT